VGDLGARGDTVRPSWRTQLMGNRYRDKNVSIRVGGENEEGRAARQGSLAGEGDGGEGGEKKDTKKDGGGPITRGLETLTCEKTSAKFSNTSNMTIFGETEGWPKTAGWKNVLLGKSVNQARGPVIKELQKLKENHIANQRQNLPGELDYILGKYSSERKRLFYFEEQNKRSLKTMRMSRSARTNSSGSVGKTTGSLVRKQN